MCGQEPSARRRRQNPCDRNAGRSLSADGQGTMDVAGPLHSGVEPGTRTSSRNGPERYQFGCTIKDGTRPKGESVTAKPGLRFVGYCQVGSSCLDTEAMRGRGCIRRPNDAGGRRDRPRLCQDSSTSAAAWECGIASGHEPPSYVNC